MAEDLKVTPKKGKGILVAILFVITFGAIIYLAYDNHKLKTNLNYYISVQDEFHDNLYARISNGYDGSHELSISDIYYRKYFSEEEESVED